MANLCDREKAVLHTIITEYIQNSEPVGSRNVSKIGPLRMSPATIRNIMGDLEEKGYLVQPHTSSGRIPTDLGYRYYIDHLVAVEGETPGLEEVVHERLTFRPKNVSTLVTEFSRRLGVITNSIGFVVTANQDTSTVRQIEFTRLSRGGTVMAILITKAGIVKNTLLHVSPDVTDSQLQYMGNYLTEQLSSMNINDLKQRLLSDFEHSVGEIRGIMSTLMDIEETVFGEDMFESIFAMEGQTNMLDFPEFQDSQKLKSLLYALEEKKTLAEILERCMNTKGIQIFVGSEIGLQDTDELGLVTSTYEKKDNIVGMLGVIGPKRMPYSKVIPVVNYSSQVISQMFNQLYGGYSDEEE